MLTFSFEIDKDIPQKDEPRYVAYAKGFIEGDLTICVGDRVFFQKSCMKVAELGIYLGQWMEQVQHGQNLQMNYETSDRDDVVLGFFYEEENQWRVSSSGQQFELQERISTTTLVESVQRYLYGLNKELRTIEYPVTFDQYLRGERMMQLSYKRLCDSKADTTSIEVYNESEQVGVVRGYYKNALMKVLDFIPKVGSNIIYEIKDSKDNIRVIAKDISRQRQRKILVTYIDNNDAEHEIIVCDGKLLDANYLFTFTYKTEEYVVHKTSLGLGKLLRKGYVIADWNIRLEEDMYYIEMNAYDEGYIQDQYLLLGVFHAVLYG
ncbi:tubby C-terminal domain-like protein [Bacillus nitratireducens]|uniref:tubby C-terminal domain-like protein n=1 Tax=Bacillus nitratireducens TaxID=2026193 RepID=UPI000BECC82E|nr:cytoplasmic protein [Bacillus nitratireducens]PEE15929.1 cytoplasmic protein [Bacillus cereus]MED0903239.1 cytoplasmic protein [Bacillus nitratireducens]PFH84518.1 cytoplasmic protein [Bacillus cereus]PFM54372.1 cytoplasmic protein [Bacillus cereus]PFS09596.1 cytoplasmic protein [Bacillus cereus]